MDDLLVALSLEQCRTVLMYFATQEDDVASLDDLVVYAARRDAAAVDRGRLAVAYHHVALPKLDEAGVVEYDRRDHTVQYRGDVLVDKLLPMVGEPVA